MVTIRKYGWSTCVFHSFWSIAFFISIAGVLFLFVKQQWVTVIVFLIFTVLMWVKTWLHSNDKLKSRIYISLFEDFLKKTMPEEDLPIMIRYDYDGYIIETMMKDGDIRTYKVEHITEKLPLYAVKIHTKPLKDEKCE